MYFMIFFFFLTGSKGNQNKKCVKFIMALSEKNGITKSCLYIFQLLSIFHLGIALLTFTIIA